MPTASMSRRGDREEREGGKGGKEEERDACTRTLPMRNESPTAAATSSRTGFSFTQCPHLGWLYKEGRRNHEKAAVEEKEEEGEKTTEEKASIVPGGIEIHEPCVPILDVFLEIGCSQCDDASLLRISSSLRGRERGQHQEEGEKEEAGMVKGEGGEPHESFVFVLVVAVSLSL